MIRQLILGAVVPGVAASILLAIAWSRPGKPAPTRAAHALIALAFAAAVAAGLWTIFRSFSLPPRSSRDFLPLAAAVALLAALGSIASPRNWCRCVAFAAGPLAVAILATRSGPVPQLSIPNQAFAVGLLASAGCLFCWSAWRLVQPASRVGLLAIHLALVGAAQILVLPLGALNLGQVVGVLAAIFAAALLTGFFLPGRSLGPAAAAFSGSFLVAPLAHGTFLGALDARDAAILFSSLPISALALLLLTPRVQRQHVVLQVIVAIVAATGPSLIAIALHVATQPSTAETL